MLGLPDAILLPVAGHLCLIFFLFVMVSIKRLNAVQEHQVHIDDLADRSNEPEVSRRWVNNLNNQFEVPTLFYALIGLLYATQSVTTAQLALAWVFLIGRVLHSYAQISGDHVALRGRVFAINFLALFGMWVLFLLGRMEVL